MNNFKINLLQTNKRLDWKKIVINLTNKNINKIH